MKPRVPSGRRTHPHTRFAHLSFVGLLAIMIVAPLVGNFTWRRNVAVASPPVESSAAAGKPRGLWYIRHGQWSADARTLVAALRYVLESDTQTNQGQPTNCFLGLELAMPTNSTAVVPEA